MTTAPRWKFEKGDEHGYNYSAVAGLNVLGGGTAQAPKAGGSRRVLEHPPPGDFQIWGP